MINDRLLLKPAEAGELLGISRSAVYNLIKRGQLRAVMLNSSLRVPRSELDRFVTALMDADTDAPGDENDA